MESISASGSAGSLKARGLMGGLGSIGLAVTVFFAGGCKKNQSAAAEPPPVVAETNQTPGVGPPPPTPPATPVVVAANPDGGADLKQLNHAYVGWVMQNRRRPKSFEEFVQLSGIKVPPPPAGKKYVIDGYGFINYANN